MKRRETAPRPDWQRIVEGEGLLFHSLQEADPTSGTRCYWGEGSYYELRPAEVDVLEAATAEVQERCLDAVQHVIDRKLYGEVGVPASAIPLIEASWEAEPPSIYGRLDLALGADGVPKLLEYNADTPTSLLESAVIQWTWLESCFPGLDQFNSIHERLIAAWRELTPYLASPLLHFGHVDELEDEMTVGYLRDTAEQAGLQTVGLGMESIGWDRRHELFVDLERRPIHTLFKLYPWEGLLGDPFAPFIPAARTTAWMEPAWKMVLSSKGILPVLWELFPDHPNLLPASLDPAHRALTGGRVRKPLHGREGSNVTIEAPGVSVSTGGHYAEDRFVYQGYVDMGEYDGYRPMLGSWLIAGEPAGLGIRETRGHVTNNTASFVPHLVRG